MKDISRDRRRGQVSGAGTWSRESSRPQMGQASREAAGGLQIVCTGAEMVPEAADLSHSASKQARGGVGRPQWGVTGVPVPPRSPPRPSPGGLHYSDEDIRNKYNGAALTEGGTLQEKSGDATESEVGACYAGPPPTPGAPRPHGAGRAGDKRLPFPDEEGPRSSLAPRSLARGWLLGQSLAQSGRRICKPSSFHLFSERDPEFSRGHRGTWWPLDPGWVRGAPSLPDWYNLGPPPRASASPPASLPSCVLVLKRELWSQRRWVS